MSTNSSMPLAKVTNVKDLNINLISTSDENFNVSNGCALWCSASPKCDDNPWWYTLLIDCHSGFTNCLYGFMSDSSTPMSRSVKISGIIYFVCIPVVTFIIGALICGRYYYLKGKRARVGAA